MEAKFDCLEGLAGAGGGASVVPSASGSSGLSPVMSTSPPGLPSFYCKLSSELGLRLGLVGFGLGGVGPESHALCPGFGQNSFNSTHECSSAWSRVQPASTGKVQTGYDEAGVKAEHGIANTSR